MTETITTPSAATSVERTERATVDPATTPTTVAPTQTTARASGDGGAGAAGTTTVGVPTFDASVDGVTECGRACRLVTATVTNSGAAPATELRIEVAVIAGDTPIWTGTEQVGTLEPGASYTTTREVSVGFSELLRILGNDGRVTVEITAVSNERTQRITREVDVL